MSTSISQLPARIDAAWSSPWKMRPRTIWTAIAVIVLLLSLLGPLGSGDGASSKVVLALMHAGAAATNTPLMRRSTTSQP